MDCSAHSFNSCEYSLSKYVGIPIGAWDPYPFPGKILTHFHTKVDEKYISRKIIHTRLLLSRFVSFICAPQYMSVKQFGSRSGRFFGGLDLDPSCLPRLSADETSREIVTMKKVNKQCLLDTPRTVRVSEKTWQVIVRTS